MDYAALTDLELRDRLLREEGGAWEFILLKVVAQEKRSAAASRRRSDWGVPLETLLGELYEDMVGRRRLENFRGDGSLVGFLRMYLRGYLSRHNPDARGFVPIDEPTRNDEGADGPTLEEKIAFDASESLRKNAYMGGDLQVLKNEQWAVARECFRELWMRNTMQAYVLLLKTRFHMSSMEIKERFGLSSAANVDQLFSRAVRSMRESRDRLV